MTPNCAPPRWTTFSGARDFDVAMGAIRPHATRRFCQCTSSPANSRRWSPRRPRCSTCWRRCPAIRTRWTGSRDSRRRDLTGRVLLRTERRTDFRRRGPTRGCGQEAGTIRHESAPAETFGLAQPEEAPVVADGIIKPQQARDDRLPLSNRAQRARCRHRPPRCLARLIETASRTRVTPTRCGSDNVPAR